MAYTFASASSQYLSATASPLGTGQLADFSVSAWVNGAAGSTTTTVFSISRSTETSGVNNPAIFLQNASGVSGGGGAAAVVLRGNTSAAGANWNSSNGGLVSGETFGGTAFDSTWHHICATLSGTTTTLYVDGSSVASYIAASVPTQTGMDRLGIGAIVRGNVAAFYSGSVADVGVWDAALDASEIASLAKAVACRLVRPQSLRFYAPLIREAIDTARALALTNNNAATVAVHPRIYA